MNLRLFLKTVVHGGCLFAVLVAVLMRLNKYEWMLAEDAGLPLPIDHNEGAKRGIVILLCAGSMLVEGVMMALAKSSSERRVPIVIALLALLVLIFKLV